MRIATSDVPEDVKRRQVKVYFERPGIVFPLLIILAGLLYGALAGMGGPDFAGGPDTRIITAGAYFVASVLIGRSLRWPADATLWTATAMLLALAAPGLPAMLAQGMDLEPFGRATARWTIGIVATSMLIVVLVLFFWKWRLDPKALAGGLVGTLAMLPVWLLMQAFGLSFPWNDFGPLALPADVIFGLITVALWVVAAHLIGDRRWPRGAVWLAPLLAAGWVVAGLITQSIIVVMSATGLDGGFLNKPAAAFAGLLPAILLLVPTGIGLHYLVRRYSRPSEPELDSWIAADMPSMIGHAKSLSGLSKFVRDPIELRHYVSAELLADAYSGVRLGKDFEWRYTPQASTVILFTEQQVALYQCAVDLTTGNRISERIYEFFYQSVTDFSWRDQTVTTDYSKFGPVAGATSKMIGMLMAKHDSASDSRILLRELRRRYKTFVVDKVLQRTRHRNYVLSLENGSAYQIPIFDGRPIGDLSQDSETARRANEMMAALEAMRAFIREKKRMALSQAGKATSQAPLV